MSIPLKFLDRIYVVFVLSLASSAFISIFVNIDSPKLTSPVTTIAWLFIYIVTVLRLMARKEQIPAAIKGSRTLFLLLGLCFISFLWSVDASATLRSSTSLAMTTLIGLDFKLRYSLEEMVRLTGYTLLGLIVIGLPFDLFLHIIPNNDFDPSTWHGVFGTKNDLGRLIVLAVALFFCLPIKSKVSKFFFICVTYAMLYRVHSTGALVNCTVILGTLLACIPLRWTAKARTLTLIILPILVAAVAYFGITHLAEVTTSVGKDPSLTGRTVLWRMAFRSIRQRPILGYGYSAFWGRQQQLAWRIREAAGWLTAPHSHSGYIEILLGLGVVGFVALLALYFHLGRKAYFYAIQNRTNLANWPVLYLTFFIFYQFTEASLVSPNSIFWILFANLSFQFATVPATQRTPLEDPVQQALVSA